MRYTTPINTLAVNSSGERQLEAHHLDDNFAAQDNAIQAITRALFASGGVAKAGTVTLTGLNLRVQDRVGVTLDTSAALHVTDLTLDLTTLPAGKGTVVMTTDPVTVNRTYTDIVTQENLTDTMTVRLGRLYVTGAGEAGVTLDAQGYPVAPANTVPVAHVTRTAGGATLDEVLNPAIQVNSSVTGPAGVSVTAAEINGSGHLILTLSDASTIDAGEVGSNGPTLPAGGATGQVLTKQSGADGDAIWQAPFTLPAGGQPGQYLTLNAQGQLVWANLPAGEPQQPAAVGDTFDTAGALNATRWQVLAGAVAVSGGKASSTDSVNPAFVKWIGEGTLGTSGAVEARVGSNVAGPLVRFTDPNNWINLRTNGDNVLLHSRTAGSYQLLGNWPATLDNATGNVLRVEYTPDALACYLDGVLLGVVNDSRLNTATGVGFYSDLPNGAVWDVSITPA